MRNLKLQTFAVVASIFAATLFAASQASAWDLRGIQRNNEGVRKFRDEKINDAYERFAQGLGDLPFQPDLHYNLGRAYFENKEYEKAVKESLTAERLSNIPELKFHALFQAAAASAALKKIDEALAFYQRALEFNPDSKETKTNIELLLAGGQGSGEGGEPQEKPQDGDKQNEPKDGNGQKPQEQPKSGQQPRPTPRPFKSESLGKKDVENILDELKQQEEQIRAKFQREGAKDSPREKDW